MASFMLKHCAWHVRRKLTSRGNCDLCSPCNLLMSTKVSPMLSMLLGMEDDESSCIYWCPTTISLYSSLLLPWSSSDIHPLSQALVPIVSQLVITSFRVVLYRCFNFHGFFFDFQNRTCTELFLHCKGLEIIFPTSGHSAQLDSEQESYALFTPSMQTVLGWFQNMWHLMIWL
jgi:hypothetical protein